MRVNKRVTDDKPAIQIELDRCRQFRRENRHRLGEAEYQEWRAKNQAAADEYHQAQGDESLPGFLRTQAS